MEWEVVDDWAALMDRMAEQFPDRQPWFFTKTATRQYTDVAFQQGDVVVFGSESNGLPPSLLEPNRDRLLRVPIREQVRSLNLSNCVGIVAYEALRQWNPAS